MAIGLPAMVPPVMPSLGTDPFGLAPSWAMNHACAPPMSELYQAPKSPAQSDRMPILIAFAGTFLAAVPLLLLLLLAELLALLLLLLLLLLPHAAIHSAQSATIGSTASRLSDHRLIPLSNLVTSSATFP
jgi:hypothetical protein